jgi:hypothetical protein
MSNAAARDGHVLARVLGPDHDDVLVREGIRHVGRKRGVPTFMRGYLYSVHPNRGAVVDGAEVEKQSLVASGRVPEGASVPDDVVEGRLPDARQL